MKLVRKTETQCHKNSGNCIAYEYPLGSSDINTAIVHISGRYPDKGYVVNEECIEVAYVLSGKGKITFKEGDGVEMVSGDMILLEKGEEYRWDGECSLCISCSPAWYPEQHKVV